VGKDLLGEQVWMEINFTVGLKQDMGENMGTAGSG